jgi:hypothetical protein
VRAVGTGDLRSVPSGQIVRKGLAAARSWSLGLGTAIGRTAAPWPSTTGDAAGVWRPAVTAQLDHRVASLELRLSYAANRDTIDGKETESHDMLTAELGVLKLFDWKRAVFGGGVRFGLDRVSERRTTSPDGSSADGSDPGQASSPAIAYYKHGSLLLRAAYQPWSWLAVYAEGAGHLYFHPGLDGTVDDTERTTATEITAGLLIYAF